MGLIKPLTYDERKKIEELLRKGATNSQIGRSLDRSRNTIKNETTKFGKRSSYCAKQGQALYDSAPDRRRKSLKAYHAKNKKPITMTTVRKRQEKISDRVSLLEQKIDVIMKILHKDKNETNT